MEKYWGNVLTSFENGVQLDLRFRLAVDLLRARSDLSPVQALDATTELIAVGIERGLVRPLPEDDGLSAPLRAHLRRGVRAQVHSQMASQTIAAEEQPKVVHPPGGVNGALLRQ